VSRPRAALAPALAPVVAALLALGLALGLVLAPSTAAPVSAAAPDLTIVTTATYDVQPEARRVHVTVQLTATNHLRDTTTRRYYFDRAALAVLPGTTGFAISGGSGKPAVSVSQSTADYTLLSMAFGQRINSQTSASFTLQFDLPDPGGDPGRDVRVGTAFVSFPVWAFATDSTPGSTVRVVFPKGFTVVAEAGTLPESTTDAEGRTVFDTGPLEAPLDYFAYLVADAPSAYLASSRRATIDSTPAELIIRAWPDDPDWSGRVGDLFQRGLPALASAIGLPWTRTEPLVVQESVSRTTGGYAGLFDPTNGFVEVAYYADAFVVLHEAAHAWFNGGLLADRWANEGFASHYAELAAATLGVEALADPLTEELQAHRIPLNAWGEIGSEAKETEDYAYAASRELARLVAERAGERALTEVWAAATRGEGAYQPSGGLPTERGAEVPDWRGLLDLLEDHAGRPFDDLWLAWVVRDEEAGLLVDRAAARELYATVAQEAGDWHLPRATRAALRAWQFDQATELLAAARRVLAARAELETGARNAGLVLPTTLRAAFEGDAGFAAALAEADAEKAAIVAYATASARRIAEPGPLETIGLIGSEPDAALAAAAEAFAAGDLSASVGHADEAEAIWLGAAEVGRNRVVTGLGIAILVGLAIAFVVSALRRRRAGRGRPDATTTPDLA
jgi:hypothetical protein